MAAVVLGATALGGFVFAALALVAGLLGLAEWLRLTGAPAGRVTLLTLAGFVVLVVVDLAVGAGPGLEFLAGAGVLLYVLLRAWKIPNALLIVVGLPYIGLAVTALVWLRNLPETGLLLMLWLFAVVWATDIGGYAVGRSLGGRKLAPRISPGKTWSGFAGGTAAALAAGGLFAGAAGRPVAWAALAAALLSVVSQIGDLFESSLKRRAGVKDSGDLIPGHGGLLDRIDGLIFAAPLMAAMVAAAGPALTGWPPE